MTVIRRHARLFASGFALGFSGQARLLHTVLFIVAAITAVAFAVAVLLPLTCVADALQRLSDRLDPRGGHA